MDDLYCLVLKLSHHLRDPLLVLELMLESPVDLCLDLALDLIKNAPEILIFTSLLVNLQSKHNVTHLTFENPYCSSLANWSLAFLY